MNDEEFKEKTKALIKVRRPELKDEEIDLHHDSSMYWGPENLAQAAEWISNTLLILREPDKYPNREVFVNFFGILDHSELAKFLKGKTDTTFKLLEVEEADIPAFIASNQDPKTREYFERVWEAKNLIEEIRKDFVDDDEFLLRFLRHRHSHVTLSDFGVRIDGKGDEAKYKTANWKRLVAISAKTSVAKFRTDLLAKLTPHHAKLSRIRTLISPEPGSRLFPE